MGGLALLVGASLLVGLVEPSWAVAGGAAVLLCAVGVYGLGKLWAHIERVRQRQAARLRKGVPASAEQARLERQLLKSEIDKRQRELNRLHARFSKIPRPGGAAMELQEREAAPEPAMGSGEGAAIERAPEQSVRQRGVQLGVGGAAVVALAALVFVTLGPLATVLLLGVVAMAVAALMGYRLSKEATGTPRTNAES